jgi:hypothetical protein
MHRDSRGPNDVAQNADECDVKAKGSSDPQIRAQFTDLARLWPLLADKVDHMCDGLDSV